MRNKVKHNAGNNIKKHKLAFKNQSRRDRESNHGPPCLPGRRANHYTMAALLTLNANFNTYNPNVMVIYIYLCTQCSSG